MTKRQRVLAGLAAGCVLWPLTGTLPAEDWPTYRHDLARSGVTREKLRYPLYEQWTHASSAPRPAWPEPGRDRACLENTLKAPRRVDKGRRVSSLLTRCGG